MVHCQSHWAVPNSPVSGSHPPLQERSVWLSRTFFVFVFVSDRSVYGRSYIPRGAFTSFFLNFRTPNFFCPPLDWTALFPRSNTLTHYRFLPLLSRPPRFPPVCPGILLCGALHSLVFFHRIKPKIKCTTQSVPHFLSLFLPFRFRLYAFCYGIRDARQLVNSYVPSVFLPLYRNGQIRISSC